MRILVLGAYGFIGSAIARDLARRGHDVTGWGRDIQYGRRALPQLRWIAGDLSKMQTEVSWKASLTNIDAIVNATGLLQSGEGGTVETVQLHAVRALIQACEAAHIGRFVQISAAGAERTATSDFMATKGHADALIEASSVPSLIIRPGLVIGRNSYGGTAFVRAAAAIPIHLRLPFKSTIQCIALTDIVAVVAESLEAREMPKGCFDVVERQHRSLDSIIAKHRQWLGFREPRWSMSVPAWSLRAMSRLSDLIGLLGWRSPLRRNGLLALEVGVQGNPGKSIELLCREPISLETALNLQPAGGQDRLWARLFLAQPLLLAALFIMWSTSGAATLLQLDRATAILQPSGISEQLAKAIAIGGGWLDILLAAALLWRRTVRAALMAMLVLTLAVYLIAGTALLPGLWIDPLAPFAKALPAAFLALVAYWTLEKR